MQSLSRWILGIGLLHTAYSAVRGHRAIAGMLRDGLVASAVDDGRRAVLWSLCCGIGLMGLGWVGISALRGEAAQRSALAWSALVLGALIVLFMPRSGGWLLLLVGVVGLAT